MSKNVIVIGAGGHGKVVADAVICCGDNVLGFLDDSDETQGKSVLGFPVLGKISDYDKFNNCEFVIAIGNPFTRKEIAETINVKWYTVIHPSAVISKLNVEIGEGTTIMPNAVINPNTKIGRHCIINTATVVEHDNVLEDYVHISPNATLSGTVHIGEATHVGAGASLLNNISICNNCVIGVGAVVVEDVTEKGTYVGVPAKKIK